MTHTLGPACSSCAVTRVLMGEGSREGTEAKSRPDPETDGCPLSGRGDLGPPHSGIKATCAPSGPQEGILSDVT